MQNKNKKISHIEFPDYLKPSIISLRDKMLQAVKNGKMDIETGEINWGKLEEDLSLPYGLLIWITETNDVLDNLNMILDDMETLKNSITMFRGSFQRRFYLLVRTFFYEFYRIKDIFNLFMKGLVKRGIINKKNADQLKEAFYY